MVVLVLFSTITLSKLMAQSRFGAGLTLGLNASQIDGDRALGFNKPGFNAGLRGVVRLTKKFDFGLEMLYSQRGSQSSLFLNTDAYYFKIKLNYIEIPFMLVYKDWETTGVGEVENGEVVSEETYHRVHFHAGLSYGRLYNSSIDQVGASQLAQYITHIDKFEKNDLSYFVGATFFLKKHLGFTVRFNQSIILNFDAAKNGISAYNLRNRHLTFGFLYMI